MSALLLLPFQGSVSFICFYMGWEQLVTVKLVVFCLVLFSLEVGTTTHPALAIPTVNSVLAFMELSWRLVFSALPAVQETVFQTRYWSVTLVYLHGVLFLAFALFSRPTRLSVRFSGVAVHCALP